jgi:hypothetical protein
VRQLQADQQTVGRLSRSFMFPPQSLAKFGQVGMRMLVNDELIWIRASIVTHGHGLASPN